MARTKITRWGNSLGIRIPKALADEIGLRDGDLVDVFAERGEIVLRPARAPRYRIEDLVAAITDENLHPLIDVGPPVGREIVEWDG